jgi:ferredoxin-type protein NapF
MMKGKRLQRLIVQVICFASASALLWPVTPWKSAPRFVLQASPFVAICSGIALRAISAGVGLGLVFAAAAVIKRRWFCRYACPTGLLFEGFASIGFQKSSWWRRCPPVGRYAALLTLAGAVIGYPVLLWMDPLSIFSSALALRSADSAIAGILAGLGLGVLILLSLASGQIWCSRICPLGGTQDLLAWAGSPWTSKSTQVGTAAPVNVGFLARRSFLVGAAGIGIGFWGERVGAARGDRAPLRPPGAVDEKHFAGLCIRCGNCVRACPSKIIHADTGQAGVAGLLAPTIRYEKKYCLEDCRACTQVCPSGALREMNLEQKRRYVIGEALVDGSQCLVPLGRKDCDACVRSCPLDAVRIHWDEERYVAYPVVSTGKCNGCGACEVVCPTEGFKAIRVWKRVD